MEWYWLVLIILGSIATGVGAAFMWFAWHMRDAFNW
jgi:hypothetical protein